MLVLDNASTDETPSVVASLDDSRLEYVRRSENVGLLANFQDALTRIDTEYGLILCDDDRLHPEFLAETVRVLDEHSRVGMVHSAFDVVDADGGVIESGTDWTYGLTRDSVEVGEEFIAESMRWGCRVCSSAALMRMSAIPRGGFEAADFPAIDFGLWLRMALGCDVAFIARALGAYRIHEGAQTAGFGRPGGAGYDGGLEWVETRERVKRRFLESHRHRLADEARLRRLMGWSRRHELLWLVRKATLPDRRRANTALALGWAARQDARIVADRDAWRLLAASLVGPRGVERLKGLRRR